MYLGLFLCAGNIFFTLLCYLCSQYHSFISKPTNCSCKCRFCIDKPNRILAGRKDKVSSLDKPDKFNYDHMWVLYNEYGLNQRKLLFRCCRRRLPDDFSWYRFYNLRQFPRNFGRNFELHSNVKMATNFTGRRWTGLSLYRNSFPLSITDTIRFHFWSTSWRRVKSQNEYVLDFQHHG